MEPPLPSIVQPEGAIPVGCPAIDELLGGGFERGTVSQVYGPPGSGKSNLALSAAVSAAIDGERALYIDTEGVSADRFDQLVSTRIEPDAAGDVTDSVLFSAVHDFDEQVDAVRDATTVAPDAGLIVLDSATGFYRLEQADEPDEGARAALGKVTDQVAHLLGLARRHALAVVITNQVYTDPETDAIRPLGGHTLAHWSGVIVRLERHRGDRRTVVLEKHRSRPTDEAVRARITASGFVGIEDEA